MAQLLCQKCRTPVQVDRSLEDLNPASFKILADAAPPLVPKASGSPRSAAARERRQQYNEASQHAGPPVQKRNVPAEQRTHGKTTPDMSYILLSDSQMANDGSEGLQDTPTKTKASHKKADSSTNADGTTALSDQMTTQLRLFEILSANSEIDHPVCTECTELLLDGLQKRQAGVIRERDAYVQFLKQAQEDVPTDEEKAQTKRELEDAQRREKQALEELEALEAEKVRMENEIATLEAEAEQLDEEEERFWRERNAFTAELTAFQEERDSLQSQLAHDNKLLESLQRTNVYNDTFCIGHDGNFGTINGLRLGKLPDHPVDWTEINAAWGQAVLLLAVVSEKLGFNFSDWRLHPTGSTSSIEKLEQSQSSSGTQSKRAKGTMLELYSSGDVPLSFGFLHRSFDNGMVAFLDCLRQLGEHVEQTSSGVRMPYKIVKDKIGDISIKFGHFGLEIDWTKACKFTLTCCKFLLAHASREDDPRDAKAR